MSQEGGMFKNFREQLVNAKTALLGALAYLYEYRIAFFKALVIPFILLIAVSYLVVQDMHVGLGILFSFLALLIQAIFAITTHRLILMGPGSVPPWGIYKLTGREVRFIMAWLGLALMGIIFSPLAFIPFYGIFIFMVLVLYFISRVSLVFPAIATDNPITFVDSWQRTKPHQVFMLLVVIVFPGIIAIPENIMSRFSSTAYISAVLSVVTTMLVIASLSMAYKIIYLDAAPVADDDATDEV